MLFFLFMRIQCGEILASEAGHTDLAASQTAFECGLGADIAKGVGADALTSLIERTVRAEQFLFSGSVNAVETWMRHHRAGNADMHFCGPRVAQQLDDFQAGGAADDGVIHQDDALAIDNAVYG